MAIVIIFIHKADLSDKITIEDPQEVYRVAVSADYRNNPTL
jgi:hypothetical protein